MKAPLIALVAALVAAPLAHAADVRAGTVTIRQPWSRPAQAGMNGVGFFTLVNAGKTPVALTGVQSPAAGKVEIHQSAMSGEVMTMRRQDKVTIPAGGQVVFAPGGYHLMLLSLKSAQAVGQKVPVTLVFDNGRRALVQLTVQLAPPPAAQAAPMGEHHH